MNVLQSFYYPTKNIKIKSIANISLHSLAEKYTLLLQCHVFEYGAENLTDDYLCDHQGFNLDSQSTIGRVDKDNRKWYPDSNVHVTETVVMSQYWCGNV